MRERRIDLHKLYIESAPHTHSKASSTRMMFFVILALLPAALAGCASYGKKAAAILLISVVSAVIAETLSSLIFRHKLTIRDLSSVVTGLILGMLLPPDFPIWKAALGSVIAIVCVKQLFGGIGRNFANPAGVAWISLLLLFHQEMTTWRIPDSGAVTRVTPLMNGGAPYWDLLLGNCAGYIGTGCAAAIVLGALFLCFMGLISPVTPAAFLGTVALLSFAGGYDVPGQLLSGSLLFAACFMASDYTTTPFTPYGKLLFGIGCGGLTFFIRHFGGYPEGAVFAVVTMNLLTPALNSLTQPRPFGFVKEAKEKKKKKKAAVEA